MAGKRKQSWTRTTFRAVTFKGINFKSKENKHENDRLRLKLQFKLVSRYERGDTMLKRFKFFKKNKICLVFVREK